MEKITYFFSLLFILMVYKGSADTTFNFSGTTSIEGTMCTKDGLNCTLCNQYNCLLSNNCFCPSKNIPHNIPLNQTPQFVFFTFDDAVTENSTYSSFWIIDALRNSNPPIKDANNCTFRPTFFIMIH